MLMRGMGRGTYYFVWSAWPVPTYLACTVGGVSGWLFWEGRMEGKGYVRCSIWVLMLNTAVDILVDMGDLCWVGVLKICGM